VEIGLQPLDECAAPAAPADLSDSNYIRTALPLMV
jgi:hypothetical protein